MRREFVFESDARFSDCHASTLAVLPDGEIVAAWFGGSGEGEPDVAIWSARRASGGWDRSRLVADEEGLPHWNPVLLLAPGGELHLYYKVGPSPSRWWTRVTQSADGGRTWSVARDLVPGDVGGRGPVKNKPVVLADGTWLAGASLEREHWDVFVDISEDEGRTWQASDPVPLDHASFRGKGVIQPTLWESSPGSVHMLLRSTSGRICRSDSTDGGRSWEPVYETELPNDNSGLDLARLDDGTLILAHNPVGENWGPRTPLVLSISRDNGASWEQTAILEDEGAGTGRDAPEFSYPSIVRYGSGVAVTYTWKRRRIAFAEAELG